MCANHGCGLHTKMPQSALIVSAIDIRNDDFAPRCPYTKVHRHPEETGKTIWKVFKTEHPLIVP